MNPLNLLTKGRTFIGFKNRPSAYKLAKGMVVPNFSAGKRIVPSGRRLRLLLLPTGQKRRFRSTPFRNRHFFRNWKPKRPPKRN